jgi:hypothetical protein
MMTRVMATASRMLFYVVTLIRGVQVLFWATTSVLFLYETVVLLHPSLMDRSSHILETTHFVFWMGLAPLALFMAIVFKGTSVGFHSALGVWVAAMWMAYHPEPELYSSRHLSMILMWILVSALAVFDVVYYLRSSAPTHPKPIELTTRYTKKMTTAWNRLLKLKEKLTTLPNNVSDLEDSYQEALYTFYQNYPLDWILNSQSKCFDKETVRYYTKMNWEELYTLVDTMKNDQHLENDAIENNLTANTSNDPYYNLIDYLEFFNPEYFINANFDINQRIESTREKFNIQATDISNSTGNRVSRMEGHILKNIQVINVGLWMGLVVGLVLNAVFMFKLWGGWTLGHLHLSLIRSLYEGSEGTEAMIQYYLIPRAGYVRAFTWVFVVSESLTLCYFLFAYVSGQWVEAIIPKLEVAVLANDDKAVNQAQVAQMKATIDMFKRLLFEKKAYTVPERLVFKSLSTSIHSYLKLSPNENTDSEKFDHIDVSIFNLYLFASGYDWLMYFLMVFGSVWCIALSSSIGTAMMSFFALVFSIRMMASFSLISRFPPKKFYRLLFNTLTVLRGVHVGYWVIWTSVFLLEYIATQGVISESSVRTWRILTVLLGIFASGLVLTLFFGGNAYGLLITLMLGLGFMWSNDTRMGYSHAQPALFWTCIVILGLMCFSDVFMSIYIWYKAVKHVQPLPKDLENLEKQVRSSSKRLQTLVSGQSIRRQVEGLTKETNTVLQKGPVRKLTLKIQ